MQRNSKKFIATYITHIHMHTSKKKMEEGTMRRKGRCRRMNTNILIRRLANGSSWQSDCRIVWRSVDSAVCRWIALWLRFVVAISFETFSFCHACVEGCKRKFICCVFIYIYSGINTELTHKELMKTPGHTHTYICTYNNTYIMKMWRLRHDNIGSNNPSMVWIHTQIYICILICICMCEYAYVCICVFALHRRRTLLLFAATALFAKHFYSINCCAPVLPDFSVNPSI